MLAVGFAGGIRNALDGPQHVGCCRPYGGCRSSCETPGHAGMPSQGLVNTFLQVDATDINKKTECPRQHAHVTNLGNVTLLPGL